jgi:hypothetical protein
MAEALQQQASPEGQMVSGHYIAPHWTQQLAALGNQIVGRKQEQNAINQFGEYQKGKQAKMAEALGQYQKDLMPRIEQAPQQPATVMGSTGEMAPNMGMVNAPARQIPVTPNDRYAALLRFSAATNNPELTQKAMIGGLEYANKSEETAGERAFREQQAKNEQEFQRIQMNARQGFELTQDEKQFANQMALQKFSQNFQAGQNDLNRKNNVNNEPLVTVMGKDGKPVYIPRSQAIGASPYSAVQEAKDVQRSSGAENFDTLIGNLRDNYNQLGTMGGITSTEKGPLSNVIAGTSSSGIGQAAGRLFGTQAQSIRNTIAQSRPLLLNAIKEATGMSAKQMDSNAEMKMYLAAATDPTLDLQTNLNALSQLETLYGKKGQTKTMSSQDQQALQWANSNPNDPRSKTIKQKLGVQ